MSKEKLTITVIHLGEESTETPSEEKLLVFSNVKFQDFLQEVVSKGFTNFAHVYSKNPGEYVILGTGIGSIQMVYTDGTIPNRFEDANSFDFFYDYKPKDASYIAEIKQPQTDSGLFTPRGTEIDPTQVLIISNRKVKEIKKILKQTEGLRDINITFDQV